MPSIDLHFRSNLWTILEVLLRLGGGAKMEQRSHLFEQTRMCGLSRHPSSHSCYLRHIG
jgi:hypothetical protein